MEASGGHKVTMEAPAVAGRQERQLIAGRYRLAFFYRGDERIEVWRAVDESSGQVVTLEFMRDREPAGRERFVAEARRLAATQQPAVVRVAGIHDDADGTFIVFEHLVPVPVLLEAPQSPPVPEPVPPVAATPPASILAEAAASESPAPDVASGDSAEPGVTALIATLRAREFVRQ